MPNKYSFNATRGTIDSDSTDLIRTWEAAAISGGAVTFSGSAMTLDTQGGAADDELTTIAPGNAATGLVLFLRSTSEDRTITLRHGAGNLWLGGVDVALDTPRRVVMLLYDGATWVLIGGAGQASTAVEVDPDPGEDAVCVVAARLVEYLDYIVNQAAAARAGGLLTVTSAVTAAIHLAQPTADQNAINAFALALVSAYADSAAIYAAFTTTVFDDAQCGLYCANSSGDGRFYASDITALIQVLAAFAGVPYDLLAALVTILGADGLTRAVGLSMLTATTANCSGGCACTVRFEWDSAGSPTLKNCTAYVDVVLRIDGAGTLPANIDVDITTAGTAGGADYTLVTPTVTFPAGSADGAVQTVQVDIGSGITSGETIVLGLDPDTGEAGEVATHTLTAGVGDCSKAWVAVFTFNTANGTQGWNRDYGTMEAGGLRVEHLGAADYTAQFSRVVRIGHSSVLSEIGFSKYVFLPQNDYPQLVHEGTVSGYLTCPNNGVAYCGVSGLAYSREDVSITCSMYNQNNTALITRIRLAGTGINPFTGE
ncbi:MAG: hypothetical protein IPK19_19345 [Chloroflexi bacterium]|nr:hypothetical protein [Chloroflexota bacterium]